MAAELGTHLSSRTLGASLRARIESLVDAGQVVTVDFAGVDTISESFADEVFAVLIEKRGSAWFRQGVAMQGLGGALRDTVLGAILERRARVAARAS
ncbi:MAG TPA: STAS-like domain-containing protein [Candidatus Nanopelagicales bacterium]|nr:STAS-like domain-containing protein [Candidatus Nanopelagicales bacterium]